MLRGGLIPVVQPAKRRPTQAQMIEMGVPAEWARRATEFRWHYAKELAQDYGENGIGRN